MTDIKQKLIYALQEAADNYVAVICNEQDLDIREALSDPIVKGWYDLIEEAKGE